MEIRDSLKMSSKIAENKSLGNKNSSNSNNKLKELSQEFEAIFLDLMLQSMRKSVPKSELMNGGNGEDMFRSMLDSEYAKTMAQGNMTGLSDAIEKALRAKSGLGKQIDKVKGNSAYSSQTLPQGNNLRIIK